MSDITPIFIYTHPLQFEYRDLFCLGFFWFKATTHLGPPWTAVYLHFTLKSCHPLLVVMSLFSFYQILVFFAFPFCFLFSCNLFIKPSYSFSSVNVISCMSGIGILATHRTFFSIYMTKYGLNIIHMSSIFQYMKVLKGDNLANFHCHQFK